MLVENDLDWKRYAGLNPDFVRRVQQRRALEKAKAATRDELDAKRRRELHEKRMIEKREERWREIDRVVGDSGLNARQIIEEIAAMHGIAVDDILGKSQQCHVREARCDAMVAVKRNKPHLSLKRLGMIFGRHHTTVLHVLRSRGVQIGADPGGIQCPRCHARRSAVVTITDRVDEKRRKRRCEACDHVFETIEAVIAA